MLNSKWWNACAIDHHGKWKLEHVAFLTPKTSALSCPKGLSHNPTGYSSKCALHQLSKGFSQLVMITSPLVSPLRCFEPSLLTVQTAGVPQGHRYAEEGSRGTPVLSSQLREKKTCTWYQSMDRSPSLLSHSHSTTWGWFSVVHFLMKSSNSVCFRSFRLYSV